MDILKNQGKLSKLRITPYKKEDFNESEKASKVSEFTVLANPEKYSLNYKVNYNEEKASGANADNPKFESSDSPNLISILFLMVLAFFKRQAQQKEM